MIYAKRYSLFIVISMVFLVNEATYRNQLHKVVTVTLPSYPSQCKVIKNEFTISMSKNDSVISLFLASSTPGLKNNSLVQCTILNNNGILQPTGFAPETVIINKEPDQSNPLYDKSIALVTPLITTRSSNPLVVTNDQPSTIYYIDSLVTDTHQNMVVTPTLNDSLGRASDGIVGLSLGYTGTLEFELTPYIFAAVKKNQGNFGENESGISVIKYDTKIIKEMGKGLDGKETEVERKEYFFNVLNASTGESHGNRANSLSGRSLFINNGTATIEADIVDLCWNSYVERLYIALHVKNGDGINSDQGARALLIGRVDSNDRLCFDPIAPDAVFVGNDKIVGACGQGTSLSLHKVRSMITTTGLPYLVVVGGVGQPDETTQQIYALPLTDRSYTQKRAEIMEDPLHGTIASKVASCQPRHIVSVYGEKLVGRAFQREAQTVDEMPTSYDSATRIGAQKKLPNAITDVIVAGDAVFVTIAEPGNGQKPGIFHSQAILDGMGRIAAWTPWQRIGGIDEGVKTAVINTSQHFLAYLKAHKPEIVGYINLNIAKNEELMKLNKAQGDLNDLLEEIFSREVGGIQGLFDFPNTTPGFSTQCRVSMLLATGYKKIVLIESGSDGSDGFFNGYKEQFTSNTITSQNGMIPNDILVQGVEQSPRALVIQGGAIEELGAISSATIATDGDQSWLIIAGSRGVAALINQDGSGWKNQPGLQPGFTGLTPGMAFKKFGNHNYIKKIMSDGCNLYILTNSTLERVHLSAHTLAVGSYTSTTLASAKQIEGAFFDMGVSGSLALLATSKGLLVNGADTDIRLDNEKNLNWHLIDLPQAKSSVYNLFFVSSTEDKNGFGHGGQVYASVGSLLENSTAIYRLYIHDVFSEGVTQQSVELLPDHIFINKPSPLVSFNSFRDHFVTDGAHYFSARSRQTSERPFLQLVSLPNIKDYRPLGATSYAVPLYIGKVTKNITALVQNSATGNWLIGGDFGLRLHN